MRVDHRTDIYSLGATLYELLCFHPAFPGNDEKEILGAVITRDPPSPRKVNNHVPQELETICNKCMEKSAESRYDTARALADDLRRYINDLPIVAKRPGPIQRVWKFSRRHRIPIAAIAAVVLLAATGVLWRRETVRRRLAQVQSRIAQIQSLRESATTFVQLNRWAEAENDLRAALKIDPDHTETLLTLAWLKLEHYRAVPAQADPKSQEEAVEICNRVLAIQPDNIHVLGYLGIALRRLQRYSEAIDVLRRALEIDPRAYASWSNLGALHAVMGDLTQAEEYLRKGTELGGVEPDEWHAAVWRNRATLELFLRKPETAGHIANALRCHSSDVQSWVLRAKMNLELVSGVNVDEALDDAKHADRIADFKDAHAKRMRALTHLAKGEDAQAMEQAKAALELNDEPSILHLILAVAEARSGRTEKAREHLDQADQNWPLALRNPGAHTAHATTGDLWIESADDRLRLLEQAKAKLVLHQP
jgi:tetratricopeptide (TPR) repeat protein